jgi:hypothetical protein
MEETTLLHFLEASDIQTKTGSIIRSAGSEGFWAVLASFLVPEYEGGKKRDGLFGSATSKQRYVVDIHMTRLH